MRYNNEFFTEILKKDQFISLPYNMRALYTSNESNWLISYRMCDKSLNTHLNTTLLHIPTFCAYHFLCSFSLLPVARICSMKCHSVRLFGTSSTGGQLCIGWGTPELLHKSDYLQSLQRQNPRKRSSSRLFG